jgi:death-on-curing protein
VTGWRYVRLADLIGGLADSGIRLVIRDAGLLESALARPQATVFGQEAYPDVWTKVAAVMHSIMSSDPFVDGNKRAGLAAALATLAINDVSIEHGDHDALFTLTLDVAAGKLDEVGEIAARLRAALSP